MAGLTTCLPRFLPSPGRATLRELGAWQGWSCSTCASSSASTSSAYTRSRTPAPERAKRDAGWFSFEAPNTSIALFTLAGRLAEVEIGDLEPGEPLAEAVPRLAAQ